MRPEWRYGVLAAASLPVGALPPGAFPFGLRPPESGAARGVRANGRVRAQRITALPGPFARKERQP